MQKPYPSSTERFHSNFQIQRELPEILNTDPDHVPEAAAALSFLLDFDGNGFEETIPETPLNGKLNVLPARSTTPALHARSTTPTLSAYDNPVLTPRSENGVVTPPSGHLEGLELPEYDKLVTPPPKRPPFMKLPPIRETLEAENSDSDS